MKSFLHEGRIYYSAVEFAMAHSGGRWKIPIWNALRNGPARYGDLKKSILPILDRYVKAALRSKTSRSAATKKRKKMELQKH
ncbi:MAG: hypothetical protein ABIN80_28295 [Dyadobacter sp.]|uniref:hypothetical protein n=1 Tax=Dyadobacter sp. TaxID=1914288 RepID=UPI003264BDF8